MPKVVFVAPFFMPATVTMVDKVASLPGVECAVVSQDAADKLPRPLRAALVDFERVDEILDPARLAAGVRALARRLGSVDRLFGALEHLQVQIAEVRDALGIPGLSVDTVRNFRDKARMKDVLRAAGVPCARHRLAASAGDALDFAREVGLPVVVKPPAGAGARATYRLDSLDHLRELLAASPPAPGREVLVEEFVQGREHTLDTISIGGRVVWHSIARYVPGPLEAMEKPWIQWCLMVPREIDHPRFDRAREIGFRALDALGMTTGLAHMEWFERADGSIAVSEVAARPPGAQLAASIGYAHGIDLFNSWARVMIYEAFEPPARRFAAGTAFLRGQGHGHVLAVRGIEEVARELGGMLVEQRLPRPGQRHNGHYEGDGYVIVRHPETGVVERALARLITGVRVIVG